MDIEGIVDGRIMFVLKRDTLFYNVICGADLLSRKLTSAVPHLPRSASSIACAPAERSRRDTCSPARKISAAAKPRTTVQKSTAESLCS